MKDPEFLVDLSQINHDAIEKRTSASAEVSSYDISQNYLEVPEDLTEKTIGYIEKEVRGSYEYKKYINYLKSELDLTRCSLLPNLDCSNGAASLEFHHYPLNLYEITETVGISMIQDLKAGEKVSCFDIAERVMEEHYRGNVGLIPLTKTLHEMAHNKSIIIPISKVNGDYKAFVKKYANEISPDIIQRIHEAEMTSESDESKLYNQMKLEKNILDLDITYIRDDEDGQEEDDDEE